MFCPRCGQEQAAVAIKFCSHCGFDLRIVSTALENEGFLPQIAELQKSKRKLTKRMGIFFSLSWWLVVSFLFNLISAVRGGNKNEIIIAASGLALGILIMALSAPFLKLRSKAAACGESFTEEEYSATNIFAPKGENSALPPKRSLSAQDYASPTVSWKTQTSGNLAESPSVVENTTKLLHRDK